jgi:rhodanese-related sulfurtransferase
MKHSPRFLALVAAVMPAVRETDVASVKAMLDRGDDFELIDVREDGEWAAAHLPGARHLGRGVLERDIEAVLPDLDRPIILYCGGGYRSALAADSIQRMGYRNVASMAGGFRAWSEARYPLLSD